MITAGELKEWLKDIPDDYAVWIRTPYGSYSDPFGGPPYRTALITEDKLSFWDETRSVYITIPDYDSDW